MQPNTHHAPGTAWQKDCSRPRRWAPRVAVREHDATRAERSRYDAALHDARADSGAAWSPHGDDGMRA